MFLKSIVPLLFAAAPTLLSAQAYNCETAHFGRDGFVAPQVIIGLDTTAQAASAYDAFIHSVHKAPIPVTLKRRSDTSYQLSWKVRNVKTSNDGTTNLSHTFTLNTAALTFTVRGRLHGYDNHISGSGTCKVIK